MVSPPVLLAPQWRFPPPFTKSICFCDFVILFVFSFYFVFWWILVMLLCCPLPIVLFCYALLAWCLGAWWAGQREHAYHLTLLGSQWGMGRVLPGHDEKSDPIRSQGNTTKQNNAQHNQNQPGRPPEATASRRVEKSMKCFCFDLRTSSVLQVL